MFALIDCNNFYASCERLFRPDLRNKPIVVLSNNDGCVIARSNEAKVLGIKMGCPFFEVKALCDEHNVSIFSSNYTLYGDISHRVMSVIQDHCTDVEIYSIDEAFLDLSSLPKEQHDDFCSALQKRILKEIGIPTSIGIGSTKTLAKIANHVAKKELMIPVFNITHQPQWLERIEVGDVWGVGRQWASKLLRQGVYTAFDLAHLNPHLLRKQYNVVMMRIAMELRGISCAGLEEREPQQSIMSSKSFGVMQVDYEFIAQAISSHCARACEKLRRQRLVAQYVDVFVQTNRFREDLPQHCKSIQFKLINPTDDLILITKVAKRCLKQLFREGCRYKKVGVCLEGLIPKNPRQMDLFNQPADSDLMKKDKLMQVLDSINERYGHETIRLAAEGFSKPWAMRAELKSPAYTTRWADLPVVKNET
nr:Y-family DNA polymerase [Legionella maceachernii]